MKCSDTHRISYPAEPTKSQDEPESSIILKKLKSIISDTSSLENAFYPRVKDLKSKGFDKLRKKDKRELIKYLEDRILKDIAQKTGVKFIDSRVGVHCTEAETYIGPMRKHKDGSRTYIDVGDIAMDVFCGTYENPSTSASIHVAMAKEALLPTEMKTVYSGPGGGSENGVIDILKAGLTGQNRIDGVDRTADLAIEGIKQQGNVRKRFMLGWSRGSMTAMAVANMARNHDPKMQIKVFCLDPVPGGLGPISFQSKHKTHIKQENKDNLHFVNRYAATETSTGFDPFIGEREHSEVLESNHQMIVGLSANQSQNYLKAGRPDKLVKDEIGKSHKIAKSDIIKHAIIMGIPFRNPKLAKNDTEYLFAKHDKLDHVQAHIKVPAAVNLDRGLLSNRTGLLKHVPISGKSQRAPFLPASVHDKKLF